MSTDFETVLERTFRIKPMKPHLEITEENMAALQAFAATHNTPIVMVNLMQVRATACYEDAVLNDCSGYEAFARYTQGSSEVRQHAGAELIWSGRAMQMPIGPSEKLGTWSRWSDIPARRLISRWLRPKRTQQPERTGAPHCTTQD